MCLCSKAAAASVASTSSLELTPPSPLSLEAASSADAEACSSKPCCSSAPTDDQCQRQSDTGRPVSNVYVSIDNVPVAYEHVCGASAPAAAAAAGYCVLSEDGTSGDGDSLYDTIDDVPTTLAAPPGQTATEVENDYLRPRNCDVPAAAESSSTTAAPELAPAPPPPAAGDYDLIDQPHLESSSIASPSESAPPSQSPPLPAAAAADDYDLIDQPRLESSSASPSSEPTPPSATSSSGNDKVPCFYQLERDVKPIDGDYANVCKDLDLTSVNR